MIERGQDAGLALEARQPLGVLDPLAGQDLEGHFPAQLVIRGAVNLPHPASAEFS
jgi:hypothetical protein